MRQFPRIRLLAVCATLVGASTAVACHDYATSPQRSAPTGGDYDIANEVATASLMHATIVVQLDSAVRTTSLVAPMKFVARKKKRGGFEPAGQFRVDQSNTQTTTGPIGPRTSSADHLGGRKMRSVQRFADLGTQDGHHLQFIAVVGHKLHQNKPPALKVVMSDGKPLVAFLSEYQKSTTNGAETWTEVATSVIAFDSTGSQQMSIRYDGRTGQVASTEKSYLTRVRDVLAFAAAKVLLPDPVLAEAPPSLFGTPCASEAAAYSTAKKNLAKASAAYALCVAKCIHNHSSALYCSTIGCASEAIAVGTAGYSAYQAQRALAACKANSCGGGDDLEATAPGRAVAQKVKNRRTVVSHLGPSAIDVSHLDARGQFVRQVVHLAVTRQPG